MAGRTCSRASARGAPDGLCQSCLEQRVLVRTALPVAVAAPSARILVGQALRLGLLQGGFLHENPLALVALARAAEADHHGRQAACLLGPPAQGGVAGGQEHQVSSSAQPMHSGWPSSMNSSEPEPP